MNIIQNAIWTEVMLAVKKKLAKNGICQRIKMDKAIRENEQYLIWRKHGIELGLPEKLLTFERYKKCKLKFSQENYSHIDMTQWD